MSKSLFPLIDLAQGNRIRPESPESTISMTTTLTVALRKSTCKMEKRREGKEVGANAYLFSVATMWADGSLVLPSQFRIGLIWRRGGCATRVIRVMSCSTTRLRRVHLAYHTIVTNHASLPSIFGQKRNTIYFSI